jgi:hypothetical protein
MSVKASQSPPVVIQADGGHDGAAGSTGIRRRGRTAAAASADELDPDEARIFSPPPLPSDPVILAGIRAGIERGLADARAGIGEDWEVVHAAIFGPQSAR